MSICRKIHDDVIKWKHFPRYWPFVWGIHRSPVNSPHKGQWRGALMISLICVWINDWVSNREAADLIRYRAHYDVSVMVLTLIHVCIICGIIHVTDIWWVNASPIVLFLNTKHWISYICESCKNNCSAFLDFHNSGWSKLSLSNILTQFLIFVTNTACTAIYTETSTTRRRVTINFINYPARYIPLKNIDCLYG